MRSGQIELVGGANACNRGRNVRGIDVGRLMSGESEQDSAIRSVAQAGESERSKKLCLHARNAIEQAAAAEFARKPASGMRAARMGTDPWYLRGYGIALRANTDFVQVEDDS
jgi:hypothetical protein